MNHPILLFGATSILGFTVARLFSDSVIPFNSPGNTASTVQQWASLHLEDPEWVDTILNHHQPQVLLYCHAVCDVPKCEADPGWANEVNIGHLERVLQALPHQTRLVYVSSDHVFGGDGLYDEQSPPCPISVYGRTRVHAERLVLERPQSLIIRTGLAIGPSPNGRTGHVDWLRYRTRRHLPVTIVEDEFRSAVWVTDLARRVMKLARTRETGIRHIPATRAISRLELAHYLLTHLELRADFHSESRHDRPTPHLGRVELISAYHDEWSAPLPSVVDGGKATFLREVA